MTMKQTDLSFLLNQQSVPAAELVDPAPSDEEIEQIMQAAMSAPDHGELKPYRFLVIQGQARHELSQVFEQAVRSRNPQADQPTIDKQKNKPLRSPMIIVVIACLTEIPKIPEIEQLLSAGCAAQHIQLACRAMGYGSVWLTGDNAYDIHVYQALGLDMNERIIGFIYTGTPTDTTQRPKLRSSANDKIGHWQRPEHSQYAI